MAKNVYKARHRRACRPVTPLTNAKLGQRSAAVVSATGMAITAVGTGVAYATPDTNLDLGKKPLANVTIDRAVSPSVNPAVVAPKDVSWTVSDELAVEVQTPQVTTEAAEDALAGRTTAADRAQRTDADAGVAGAEHTAAPASTAGGAVGIAMQYVGSPYVWAGESPAGFDCSGLVKYVFAQLGYNLPHSSGGIGQMGTKVSAAEAKPGDIVYYPYGHVAIYAGNGMVVEALNPGMGVQYGPVMGAYHEFVRL
ncbi:C40 family peptidase [Gleimia hominis]|uniref:C40 family peptidase n=1 Tax=Gleimia hominis TaxID=595468 RepID=UPI000C807148|nr:C40 family peptidase [Gleimia hominis]WIK63800.1 C40 family peptidase [Gleimia hominis]